MGSMVIDSLQSNATGWLAPSSSYIIPYWILFDKALKWKTEHANINKVAGQCYNAIVSSLGWRPFIYTTLDNASPILCAYFLELLRHVIRRTRYIGLIPLQHKISLNCIHVTKKQSKHVRHNLISNRNNSIRMLFITLSVAKTELLNLELTLLASCIYVHSSTPPLSFDF